MLVSVADLQDKSCLIGSTERSYCTRDTNTVSKVLLQIIGSRAH